MKSNHFRLVSLLLLLPVTALIAQPAPPSPEVPPSPPAEAKPAFPIEWPPMEGWRTETIPFPLDFAPGLDYPGGLEELRFSPAFGKVEDPLYFSYAFVWLVPEKQGIDLERLKKDLKGYFDGLMTAVARDAKVDLGTIDTRIALAEGQGENPRRFKGTVETVDAFFSKKALVLQIEIDPVPCNQPGMQVWYFDVSPKLDDTATRALMSGVRSRLGCPGP